MQSTKITLLTYRSYYFEKFVAFTSRGALFVLLDVFLLDVYMIAEKKQVAIAVAGLKTKKKGKSEKTDSVKIQKMRDVVDGEKSEV